MTKKMMTIAEVELIRLDADDILTSSPGLNDSTVDDDDPNNYLAPSRYNYRGMETDWEEQDW